MTTTRETADHAELARRLRVSWSDRGWVASNKIKELLGEAREAADALEALLSEIAALRGERDRIAGESIWWKGVIGDASHQPSGEIRSIKHMHPAMVKPIYDAHKGTAVADVIAGLIFSLAITQNREQFLVEYANDRATQAERQRDELRKALEPFAKAADKLDGLWSEDDWRWNDSVRSGVTVRDIRRASKALANQGADPAPVKKERAWICPQDNTPCPPECDSDDRRHCASVACKEQPA